MWIVIQPISDRCARSARPPSTRARIWLPKQMPSTGTSASVAARSSRRSRAIHGTVSSYAAASEPSVTTRS